MTVPDVLQAYMGGLKKDRGGGRRLMRLRSARVLVSNDDGINAWDQVLERIANLTLSDDVWVVAPESEQSASGHSLTLTSPLRVGKSAPESSPVNRRRPRTASCWRLSTSTYA